MTVVNPKNLFIIEVGRRCGCGCSSFGFTKKNNGSITNNSFVPVLMMMLMITSDCCCRCHCRSLNNSWWTRSPSLYSPIFCLCFSFLSFQEIFVRIFVWLFLDIAFSSFWMFLNTASSVQTYFCYHFMKPYK